MTKLVINKKNYAELKMHRKDYTLYEDTYWNFTKGETTSIQIRAVVAGTEDWG